MAGLIPESFIDDVVSRTDIVEIIEHYVPLKRAGKEFKACCPFHDERTPSFTVVPDKQFFHCFGCGAHGTAIGFLMDYANLEFVEAVEELARRIGLEVPRESRGEHGPRMDLEPVFDALERANSYYQGQLRHHEQASRAVNYLKGRGLSGKIAAEFQLGFAPPGWGSMRSELAVDDRSRTALMDAGLLIAPDDGRPYDRFRDRITFPIHDSRGRVVGFGARIIDDGEPKYLNSPETPVFHKGRELYGLWRARRAGRSPVRILVVEGYMDVVALAQSGIDYAVATLGTAVTEAHVERLFRGVNEIVFCFDGDEAGRRAAWRAVENTLPAMKAGRKALFQFLPEGEDPDSLVRTEGKDAFENRLEDAVPLSRFAFNQLAAGVDLTTPEGGAGFIEHLRPLVNRIPAGPFRRQLVVQIGESYAARIPGARNRRQVERWLDELAGDDSLKGLDRFGKRMHAHTERLQGSESPATRAVRILLHNPSLAAIAADVEQMRSEKLPDVELLTHLIELLRTNPKLKMGGLVERFRSHDWFPRIEELARREPAISDRTKLEVEFVGCLQRIADRAARQRAQRRVDELAKRGLSELSDRERRELAELTGRRSPRRNNGTRRGN